MSYATKIIAAAIACAAVATHAKPANVKRTLVSPKELIGTWEVIAGRMDEGAGPYKIPYKPNDVRYMAMELMIEAKRVSYDVTEVCESPKWEIAPSIVRREIGYMRVPSASWPKGKLAPLKDMGFHEFRLNDPLTSYTLRCGDGQPFGPAWLFMGKNKDVLYRGTNDLYLVFKKRLPNAKPSPSFSCEGDVTATQRAICGSIAMSLRERSLANVWINEGDACRPNPNDCPPEKRAAEVKAAETQYRQWFREEVEPCGAEIKCIMENLRTGGSIAYKKQWHDGNRDLR
jgi:hypothetical protein